MDSSGLLSQAKVCDFQLFLWVHMANCIENAIPAIPSEQMDRDILTNHHRNCYRCLDSLYKKNLLFSHLFNS